ncbi:zinc-finger of the MIZ type in Nse subunit-domain-containing protein [Pyronema omphalodes]|nr:zinc-finger of the MIZ type in Nse subunit-domain-containing protein [Pyronema omphalodes]
MPRTHDDLPVYEPPLLPLHPTCIPTLSRLHTSLTPCTSELNQLSSLLREVSESTTPGIQARLLATTKLLIDSQASVANTSSLLQSLSNSSTLTDDSDDPHPVSAEEGFLGLYRSGIQSFDQQWQQKSEMEKYSTDETFSSVYKISWDVLNPELPVPNVKRWFMETGDKEDNDEDDDDDIEVAQENVSYKCPLTLLEFVEPVTARCGHSFEKEAVLGMFRRGATIACPVPGCNKQIQRAELKRDTFLEGKMRRRKEREERERRRRQMEGEDQEAEAEEVESGDEAERSMVKAKEEKEVKRVKKEKLASQRTGRGVAMDLESDDE